MVWASQHESSSVTPEVILPSPGTSRVYTDEENVAAASLKLDEAKLRVCVEARDPRCGPSNESLNPSTIVAGASESAETPLDKGYNRRNYVEDACCASHSSQGRIGAR